MDTERAFRCLIAGAGEIYGRIPAPGPDCLVIAADGGLRHLIESGVSPDITVGDFDSLECATDAARCGGSVSVLPKEKDETDTLAAINLALGRGCREFHIFGGTGGRSDHTAANIQCLAYIAERGGRGFLYGNGRTASCLKDGSAELTAPMSMLSESMLPESGFSESTLPESGFSESTLPESGFSGSGIVSVLAFSDTAEGVTLEGFKYPLKDATLNNTFPLGVSNELSGVTGRITVKSGTLLIYAPAGGFSEELSGFSAFA